MSLEREVGASLSPGIAWIFSTYGLSLPSSRSFALNECSTWRGAQSMAGSGTRQIICDGFRPASICCPSSRGSEGGDVWERVRVQSTSPEHRPAKKTAPRFAQPVSTVPPRRRQGSACWPQLQPKGSAPSGPDCSFPTSASMRFCSCQSRSSRIKGPPHPPPCPIAQIEKQVKESLKILLTMPY